MLAGTVLFSFSLVLDRMTMLEITEETENEIIGILDGNTQGFRMDKRIFDGTHWRSNKLDAAKVALEQCEDRLNSPRSTNKGRERAVEQAMYLREILIPELTRDTK